MKLKTAIGSISVSGNDNVIMGFYWIQGVWVVLKEQRWEEEEMPVIINSTQPLRCVCYTLSSLKQNTAQAAIYFPIKWAIL